MGKGLVGAKLTYFDGKWLDGEPELLSPHCFGVWLSSMVFDGARAFQGHAPDLDLHCARVIRSARILGMQPTITGPEIEKLAWEGIRRFPEDAELYICPMIYAASGFIAPDPDSARFVMAVSEAPLPPPDGFSACLTKFRRPARNMAPTDAKASCLYPNVARCVNEATEKGFETAVVLDPNGNVAEFAYTNLFMVKDGVVHTPVPNGTFLNGLTRQRIASLLREDGVTVVERSIDFEELLEADEMFGTGNFYKLAPCTRLEDRDLQIGPVFKRARELYFEFARKG